MSNKKLSRLLEPNLKLYFFCMALFVAATVPVSIKLAVVEGDHCPVICVFQPQG